MIFEPAPLDGAFLIEPERAEDSRGFFARVYCAEEFQKHGLEPLGEQCNVSYNLKKGTVRGLHYQIPPYAEAKSVRCTAGAIFDVIVDLREGSPSFGQYAAFELSQRNRSLLYIPEGFAHGFQTLTDEAEVFYQMSSSYVEGAAAGVLFSDPELGIAWPETVTSVSERDAEHPVLSNVTPL